MSNEEERKDLSGGGENSGDEQYEDPSVQDIKEPETRPTKKATKSGKKLPNLLNTNVAKSNPDIAISAPAQTNPGTSNYYFPGLTDPQSDLERQIITSQLQMSAIMQSLVPIVKKQNASPKKDKNQDNQNNEKQLQLFLKEAREQKIYFSGSHMNNASWFLREVEALLDFYPLPFNLTIKGLRKLMQAEANDWFVNHKGEFTSWQTFKQLFESYFIPKNRDALIRVEICSRKQRADESVTKYMSEMRRLNMEMTKPLTELELVEMFKLHLHARFRVHVTLADIRTLNELEQFCVQIEKAEDLDGQLSAIDKATVTCYKCNKKGHFARECSSQEDIRAQPKQPQAVNSQDATLKAMQDLTEMVKTLQTEIAELKRSKNE